VCRARPPASAHYAASPTPTPDCEPAPSMSSLPAPSSKQTPWKNSAYTPQPKYSPPPDTAHKGKPRTQVVGSRTGHAPRTRDAFDEDAQQNATHLAGYAAGVMINASPLSHHRRPIRADEQSNPGRGEGQAPQDRDRHVRPEDGDQRLSRPRTPETQPWVCNRCPA